MRVAVIAALFPDETENADSAVKAEEGDDQERTETITEVRKIGQDAEGRHDDHEEPAKAIGRTVTELPTTDHNHGGDDEKNGEPEEDRVHLRSHHHRLGEEGNETRKDKEDKEEILHDAATLALAFGPSSASEMKRKEARDRSLASPLIFKSGSFVYLEGASGAGAIGSAALGLLLNQFIGQSLLRQQAKPLFSEDPPPALGDSALL
ncbi:MAG: hypothetical protein ACI8T1_003003 [Verrucomicrobiales bacterium]|jgi:hypothetical protein